MSMPAIVSTANDTLRAALQAAIDDKTKPRGSLGVLESLALRMGLIQASAQPSVSQPTIIVFAGDHGVTDENISAYPQSVTWQMVENFLAEGAAINVFARQNDCALLVVDAGVNHDFGVRPGLLDRKVGPGTRNFAVEPAMCSAECANAMQLGARLVDDLRGNVLGFGEMGIGNTTSAAALMHVLTGIDAALCVGAGTGLDAAGVRHKQAVIEAARRLHAGVTDPLAVLATFGGYEIAMMAGAMLRAAERRMVLVIDGFIVTAALLVAARLQPAILEYCVFSHCSQEQGHRLLLEHLQARPLMQLDLRLGEGSGAALALPLLRAAVNFLAQMATFSSAQVSQEVGATPDAEPAP